MGQPKTGTKSKSKTKLLPPFKVILENDEVNEGPIIVQRIVQLTPLDERQAIDKTVEAHQTGRSVLLVTHRERAELYQEQFAFLTPPIAVTLEAE